ncbi:MAG TPA: FixH family protein [Blastocatellia bacterium]|nr:FixH family protein [Blastocatellia bacterium]
MIRKFAFTLSLVAIISLLAALSACNQSASGSGGSGAPAASTGKVIASQKAGDLTVTLLNPAGHLSEGNNDFTVEFKDAGGRPVDVGAITMMIDMPAMGSMPRMESKVKLLTTGTPGIYQATTSLEMNGTWQVHVAYKGPAGEGKADFPIQTK